VEYQIAAGSTQIEAAIDAQRPDFAIAPINFAAQNFNTTGNYILGGVVIWGMFHVVENVSHPDASGSITPIAGLAGETIYAYGLNMAPNLVLEMVLAEHGLTVNRLEPGSAILEDAVNIRYLETVVQVRDAIMGQIAGLDARFGLLSEPLATALVSQPPNPQNNHADFRRTIDLSLEWSNFFGASYPQAAIMVRASLAQSNPALVAAVIDMIAESTDFARQNPDEVARIAVDELNSAALPGRPVVANFIRGTGQSVFVFQNAIESRDAVVHYLGVLYDSNPLSVGGVRTPPQGFFFH
jgi:ABC-type nitrate/sulfonate/bicarbonate transport system substrate-binding protein